MVRAHTLLSGRNSSLKQVFSATQMQECVVYFFWTVLKNCAVGLCSYIQRQRSAYERLEKENDQVILRVELMKREKPLIVCTTTQMGYNKLMKDYGAYLTFRIEPIHVEELSKSDTVSILRSMVPHLQKSHQKVTCIEDSALHAAADIADRYLRSMAPLPTSAILAMDYTIAFVSSRVDENAPLRRLGRRTPQSGYQSGYVVCASEHCIFSIATLT